MMHCAKSGGCRGNIMLTNDSYFIDSLYHLIIYSKKTVQFFLAFFGPVKWHFGEIGIGKGSIGD